MCIGGVHVYMCSIPGLVAMNIIQNHKTRSLIAYITGGASETCSADEG